MASLYQYTPNDTPPHADTPHTHIPHSSSPPSPHTFRIVIDIFQSIPHMTQPHHLVLYLQSITVTLLYLYTSNDTQTHPPIPILHASPHIHTHTFRTVTNTFQSIHCMIQLPCFVLLPFSPSLALFCIVTHLDTCTCKCRQTRTSTFYSFVYSLILSNRGRTHQKLIDTPWTSFTHFGHYPTVDVSIPLQRRTRFKHVFILFTISWAWQENEDVLVWGCVLVSLFIYTHVLVCRHLQRRTHTPTDMPHTPLQTPTHPLLTPAP